MARKNKNDIDEDFLRQIREAAKPVYYTASTIHQESSNRSDDKPESLGGTAEQVANVATATNTNIVTEAVTSPAYQHTETIEVVKVNEVSKATDVANVTNATKADDLIVGSSSSNVEKPLSKESASKDETTIPTPKPTRISAKMRKATRAEFRETYTGKTDTKGGKPITIAPAIIERLYRVCSLSGNRNACPTYVINNLLSEFLDAVEPEAKKWGLLD